MSTDWTPLPTFGAPPPPGMAAVPRPSAYALLRAPDGRLAVVRTPAGVYLPGGGIAAGESVEAALHREVAEECGATCTLEAWRVRAVDRVYAAAERTHYAKQSTFVAARLEALSAPPAEPDHRLEWLTAAEASTVLSHTGQRWAVAQWHAAPYSAATPGGVPSGGDVA